MNLYPAGRPVAGPGYNSPAFPPEACEIRWNLP